MEFGTNSRHLEIPGNGQGSIAYAYEETLGHSLPEKRSAKQSSLKEIVKGVGELAKGAFSQTLGGFRE